MTKEYDIEDKLNDFELMLEGYLAMVKGERDNATLRERVNIFYFDLKCEILETLENLKGGELPTP